MVTQKMAILPILGARDRRRPDAAGIAEGERPAVFDRLRKAVAIMQGGA